MTVSILRLKAPLLSFGGPKVLAKKEPTQAYPALSMVTGLLANALGYDRTETERHEELQRSITYAVREDERGEKLTDFQTADLGSDVLHHRKNAWTTKHEIEERAGGSPTDREIRYREYLSDSSYTIALTSSILSPEEIREALLRPARPLFIGRQACLPSSPIYRGTVEAKSAFEALQKEVTFSDAPPEYARIWHEDDAGTPVSDRRDWSAQTHVGQRRVKETTVFF
jgi:CRISPR system Cascade subunit CasD